jgi:hypothetical protein
MKASKTGSHQQCGPNRLQPTHLSELSEKIIAEEIKMNLECEGYSINKETTTPNNDSDTDTLYF